MIGKVIYQRMKAVTGVTDLVGDKIYPMRRGQKIPLPGVIYQHISENPEYVKDGFTQINKSRFQLNVYSASYSEVQAILFALRQAFEAFSSPSFFGYCIDRTQIESVDDGFDNSAEVFIGRLDLVLRNQYVGVDEGFGFSSGFSIGFRVDGSAPPVGGYGFKTAAFSDGFRNQA